MNAPATPMQPERPLDTTEVGIFDLGLAAPTPRGWMVAIMIAALVWLGTVSFIGQYRRSPITRPIAELVPLGTVVWACTIAAAAIGVACAAVGLRGLAVLAAGATGLLAGHWLFAAVPLHQVASMRVPFRALADGGAFSLHRVVYLTTVGGSALAATVLAGRLLHTMPTFHFGLGRWNVVTREFTTQSTPQSYAALLVGFVVFAALLFVVCQASVGFAPLRNGTWPSLLPAILLAALVNATVEELLFRGVLQPAILGAAGAPRGLWIQGLLFGLMHWGLSVGVLAALPTSLAIGVGSVIWGKSVLETRGLSWVIVCHALCDVAIMSAYFLPAGEGTALEPVKSHMA